MAQMEQPRKELEIRPTSIPMMGVGALVNTLEHKSIATNETPMKYKLIFCLTIFASVLSGCASAKWYLNGRSQAELSHAFSICDQFAYNQGMGFQGSNVAGPYAAALAGLNYLGQMNGYDMALNSCMAQHGFTRAQ